ncbi:MAG: nucleoside deaminase [Bacteroidales bacterium]
MQAIESYMDKAFDEAFQSVRENIGGPFGAVVVLDGKVIGKGGNRVSSQNDPTAHAEIVAIRDACKNIKNFDLAGAVIYATCEPCPMCLSAIYWANIKAVYYCATRHDAAFIGFKDNHIYEELNLLPEQRMISFQHISHPKAVELFSEWSEKNDKIPY